LVGREGFQSLWPEVTGFGLVLVNPPRGQEVQAGQVLRADLADFGATVTPADEYLDRYLQVANTYLSTFRALGAVALTLGTLGLAIVLLRSLVERRAEQALLTALGFSPARRAWLLVAENGLLLLAGLGVGLLVPLIGVRATSAVAWSQAAGPVGLAAAASAVIGLSVLAISAWLAGRKIKPADLRQE
jgi:ABC-type antimicrobial peptide transport system permease subunit